MSSVTAPPLTAEPYDVRQVRFLEVHRPPAQASDEVTVVTVDGRARYRGEVPGKQAAGLGAGTVLLTCLVIFIAAVYLTPHLGFHTLERKQYVPAEVTQPASQADQTTYVAATHRPHRCVVTTGSGNVLESLSC